MDTITSRQEHRNGAGAAVRRSLGGVWAGRLGGRVEMVQNGQIQNTFEGPDSRGLWVDWSGVRRKYRHEVWVCGSGPELPVKDGGVRRLGWHREERGHRTAH